MDEEKTIKHIKKYDLYYDFLTDVQKYLYRRKGMRLSYNRTYKILKSWSMLTRVNLIYNNQYAHCANHIYNSWYQKHVNNEMFYSQKPFSKKALDKA